MNPILINGVACSPQPSKVNENPLQFRTVNRAIDGTPSVAVTGTKNQAVLGWDYVPPAFFQLIKALGDGSATVTYQNTSSNVAGGSLSFTGILSYQEDAYMPGSSQLVPLVVTIIGTT